jgi:hypothetical protein
VFKVPIFVFKVPILGYKVPILGYKVPFLMSIDRIFVQDSNLRFEVSLTVKNTHFQRSKIHVQRSGNNIPQVPAKNVE